MLLLASWSVGYGLLGRLACPLLSVCLYVCMYSFATKHATRVDLRTDRSASGLPQPQFGGGFVLPVVRTGLRLVVRGLHGWVAPRCLEY